MRKQRMMPNDIEAEQALLGAILQGNKIPPLSPDDFYKPAHGSIFKAMATLEAKQEPIDYYTVKAELERVGKLEKIGGLSYLSALIEQIPPTAYLNSYAELVKEQAIKRKVISSCQNLVEMAFSPMTQAQEVLDKLQAESLGINGGGSTCSTLAELAKSQLKQVEDAFLNKKPLLGIPSGFKDLDRVTLGWQAPDLVIIAARPSMGKTALALDVAKTAALSGTKVFFASLEMSAQQLSMRLLSSESSISGRSLRMGSFPKGDWNRIVRANAKIAKMDILIDDTGAISELELARRVRRVQPGLLVVDYLQLLRSALKADRKDLEIGNITAGLKALAKELQIPVILLSQLNREAEKRANPRPMLSDLRESGAIEQDADLVLGIYRDLNKSPGKAELICLKHRNGPTGTVTLAFREEETSFADLSYEEEFSAFSTTQDQQLDLGGKSGLTGHRAGGIA